MVKVDLVEIMMRSQGERNIAPTYNKRFISFAEYKGDGMKEVAEVLDISRQALYDKLTQKFSFNDSEIQKLIIHWDMTPQQVYDLFLIEGLEEIIEKYKEGEKKSGDGFGCTQILK